MFDQVLTTHFDWVSVVTGVRSSVVEWMHTSLPWAPPSCQSTRSLRCERVNGRV